MEKRTDLETSNTEMVTISRAEYETIQARLSAQDEQLRSKTEELAETLLKNQWLLEQLKLTKKKLFGASSEQLDQMVMEQFGHLFNEAEGWDASSYVKETKVKSHTRKRRSGSIEDVIPEGTPTEVVEHRLPEKDRICHVCGTEMVEIGTEVHRSLQMKPAQFWVREDVYYTYACKACEQETGEAVVVSTPREPSVLPGSYASPRAIAHIMTQKYVMHSPLYRLQQEFERQGLKLSRQTMSNWLLSASDTWLKPIYEELHRKLCQETVVLLSKGEVDSKKIRVEFSLEDMDMSEFQNGATYPQIKDYVLEHSGLKVSNLYISQIKRKCGIEVGKNYNLPKSDDSRQPLCPPEKEKAIREAFKYFGMI